MKSRNVWASKLRGSVIYIFLVVSVVLVMITRFFREDYYAVFLCLLTLGLFHIPVIVEHTLNLTIPQPLEIVVLLFIFASEILGEIASFYTYIPWWDSMLHAVNGFLMASIGFALIDLLNNSPRFHFSLSPVFVAFVAFCFSMTVGVIWEFFEFGMDMFTGSDMQKDYVIDHFSSVLLHPEGVNDPVRIDGIEKTALTLSDGRQVVLEGYLDVGIIDTMKDLLVNCVGALIFSFVGDLYILGRSRGSFVKKFIPQMKKRNR
ncbi:MAG: hypothetical protein IJA85_00860 [Clostridia bacterium]|nr:hypothetical protein [Clostridia bacterium]